MVKEEPPNNRHVGTRHFVLFREVVLSSEVKNVLEKWNFGTLKCVFYREVFFYCVHYLECPLSDHTVYCILYTLPLLLNSI